MHLFLRRSIRRIECRIWWQYAKGGSSDWWISGPGSGRTTWIRFFQRWSTGGERWSQIIYGRQAMDRVIPSPFLTASSRFKLAFRGLYPWVCLRLSKPRFLPECFLQLRIAASLHDSMPRGSFGQRLKYIKVFRRRRSRKLLQISFQWFIRAQQRCDLPQN